MIQSRFGFASGKRSLTATTPFGSVVPLADCPLVHRTDYHPDGSETDTYYLELTRDQFRALGGQDLEPLSSLDDDAA